jgi:hypothetical protein
MGKSVDSVDRGREQRRETEYKHRPLLAVYS